VEMGTFSYGLSDTQISCRGQKYQMLGDRQTTRADRNRDIQTDRQTDRQKIDNIIQRELEPAERAKRIKAR
jgi:hypothetical protein